MDTTFVVNLWFLVAFGLFCVILGGLLFKNRGIGRDRYRY